MKGLTGFRVHRDNREDTDDRDDMGGVNDCRLAKFRGLIYVGKYSAVIGLE